MEGTEEAGSDPASQPSAWQGQDFVGARCDHDHDQASPDSRLSFPTGRQITAPSRSKEHSSSGKVQITVRVLTGMATPSMTGR